jgi:eukaryotic-like serine/threonine-protein kinase
MNNLINTYLGQYLLLQVIGRGSTSVVYKAQQPSLNRFVAVKVLLRHLDPQLAARFRREAHAIAQLQHPNILPIYDYGQQDGLHYFVIQYIENGVTLHDLMTSQPIDLRASLRLTGHLLAALEYAHTRGVIHRDVKPSNVLMHTPEWPILADFGIAKLLDDNQGLPHRTKPSALPHIWRLSAQPITRSTLAPTSTLLALCSTS